MIEGDEHEKAKRRERHGHGRTGSRQGTPTYCCWVNMNRRCTNPKDAAYPHYGGRGIAVCARWSESFLAFLADMGEMPPGKSLDRKNNDLGYEPDNCRWATDQEQLNNRRGNRLLTLQGQTMTLAQWARTKGMRPGTLRERLVKGLSLEQALETPLDPIQVARARKKIRRTKERT